MIKNSIKARSIQIAVVTIGALLVSACGGSTPPETPKTTTSAPETGDATSLASPSDGATAVSPGQSLGSTLTVAENTAPDNFDPTQSALTTTSYAWQLVYEGLIRVEPDGNISPLLATEWSESEDSLSYTFHLRQGVKFHNGDEFTAGDVVFSFNRMLTNGVPSIKSFFGTLQSVEAPSPDVAVFHLSAPDATFLLNLGNPLLFGAAILDEKWVKDHNPATSMLGTGPFKMVSYAKDRELVLEANPSYWGDGVPSVEKLVVRYISDQSAQVAALKSGQIDLMFPSSESYMALKSDPKLHVDEVSSSNILKMNVNNASGPLEDQSVRQAIALALDRDQIVKLAYLGHGTPSSYFPPGAGWATPLSDMPLSARDVDRAKELLADAGHGQDVALTLSYPTGYADYMTRAATVIQSQLAEVGVDVTLKPQEQGVWLDELLNAKYQLTLNEMPFHASPFGYIQVKNGRQGPTPKEIQALMDRASAAKNSDELIAASVELAKKEAELVFPDIGLATSTIWAAYAADTVTGVDLQYTGWRGFLYSVVRK